MSQQKLISEFCKLGVSKAAQWHLPSRFCQRAGTPVSTLPSSSPDQGPEWEFEFILSLISFNRGPHWSFEAPKNAAHENGQKAKNISHSSRNTLSWGGELKVDSAARVKFQGSKLKVES